MHKIHCAFLSAALVAVPALLLSGAAFAQSKGGSGKIVCWKDKNGKVIGCGDRVPPEYRESATKELDQRGVTRRTTESAEEEARRRAQEEASTRQKAEEKKKLVEQQRQDTALINTFSNEKEIDLKRDRDLLVVESQLKQMQVSLKNATDRYNEARGRAEAAEKSKRPLSDSLKEDLARTANEKQKIEQDLAAREKEKEGIRRRYAEMRERYLMLKGGGTQATAANPAPSAAPVKK